MFYKILLSFVLVLALGLSFSLGLVSNSIAEESTQENSEYEAPTPEDYEEEEIPSDSEDDTSDDVFEEENTESEEQ